MNYPVLNMPMKPDYRDTDYVVLEQLFSSYWNSKYPDIRNAIDDPVRLSLGEFYGDKLSMLDSHGIYPAANRKGICIFEGPEYNINGIRHHVGLFDDIIVAGYLNTEYKNEGYLDDDKNLLDLAEDIFRVAYFYMVFNMHYTEVPIFDTDYIGHIFPYVVTMRFINKVLSAARYADTKIMVSDNLLDKFYWKDNDLSFVTFVEIAIEIDNRRAAINKNISDNIDMIIKTKYSEYSRYAMLTDYGKYKRSFVLKGYYSVIQDLANAATTI